MIASIRTSTGRRLALELLLRGLAVAVMAILIMGLLPAIAEAAG